MFIKQWPVTNSLCRVCKLAVLCGFLLAMYATAGAVPMAPVAPPQIHRAPVAAVKNPHLKGVEPAAATHVKPTVKKAQTPVHQTWRRRWDYHTWIALHRGLGTIRGFVHGPAGGAMSTAKVLLRKPNGAFFASVARKHITYTDAQGNFMMVGVRAGSYRVVAFHGKLKGHVQIAVHPGFAANVSVKV
jgi:hypothetical protein